MDEPIKRGSSKVLSPAQQLMNELTDSTKVLHRAGDLVPSCVVSEKREELLL